MSKDVQRCPKMSKDVQRCPKMSKDVQRCPKMSKDVKDVQRCPKMSKDVQSISTVNFSAVSHHQGTVWSGVGLARAARRWAPQSHRIRGRSDSDKKLPQSQWKPHNEKKHIKTHQFRIDTQSASICRCLFCSFIIISFCDVWEISPGHSAAIP